MELSGANSRVPEDRKPAQLLQRARRPVRRWGAAKSTDRAVLLMSRSESWVSPVSTASWRTWTSSASRRHTDNLDRRAQSQAEGLPRFERTWRGMMCAVAPYPDAGLGAPGLLLSLPVAWRSACRSLEPHSEQQLKPATLPKSRQQVRSAVPNGLLVSAPGRWDSATRSAMNGTAPCAYASNTVCWKHAPGCRVTRDDICIDHA